MLLCGRIFLGARFSSCDLSPNFGAQGLRSWGLHFGDNSSRWDPFFSDFSLVPGALGEFDGVDLIPILPGSSGNRLPKATDAFATTFLLLNAGLLPQHVEKKHVLPKCALVVLTYGRVPKTTWRIITISVSARILLLLSEELASLLPDSIEGFFLPRRLSWPSKFGAAEDDCPVRLWPPPRFPRLLNDWKLHERPFDHCPCDLHWKDSPSTTSFRSIWSFTDVCNLE